VTRGRGIRKGGWILALALLPAGAVAGRAEEPRQADATRLSDAVTRIVPGRSIRLAVPQYGDVSGRFLRNNPDSLFMNLHGETRSVPLAGIDRLWLRKNSMKQGLLIGGVAGFVTLAALYSGEDSESDGGAGGVLFIGAIGGILGGFAGSMVGLAVPRWRLEYDATGGGAAGRPVPMRPGGPSPPVEENAQRRRAGKAEVEVFGGYDALGRAQSIVGGRFLLAGSPGFQFGIDIAGISYADEERRTGFSFVCGPSFTANNLRPRVLVGAGVYSRTYEVQTAYGGPMEQTDHNFIVQISPGVCFGLGRLGLLVEGRYQIMAIGEFDDLLAVAGGLNYSF